MSSNSTSADLNKKLQNIGLITLGGAIIIVNVLLYRYNVALFSIFLTFYIITYIGILLAYLYKNQAILTNKSRTAFDVITYFSFYTILMQLALMTLSIIAYVYSMNKSK